jgi:PadR family transcriptional regulator, regulatory protein PadR
LQEQRLLNARHVEVAGRTRKVYALTAAGRRELAAERTQWQRFSQVVSQVMGAPA